MKPTPFERLDALVPPSLRLAAPAVLRRARLIVQFSLVLASIAAVFVPLYVWEGHLGLSAVIALSLFADLLPIGVLWRTRSTAIAGALPGLFGTVLIGVFALILGGIHGTAPYWGPLILIATMLLSGRRGAMAVGVAQVALLIGLVVVDLLGVALPVAPPSAPALTAFALGILSAGTFGLVSLFEAANERMRVALEQRNSELRYVLDNVGQGFFCADREGRPLAVRSAAIDQWFGAPGPDARLWSWLGEGTFAVSAELGWIALWEDVLPVELCLDQLPSRVTRGGRTFGLEYRPVYDANQAMERVVVVLTDITHLLETERSEVRQREFAGALDHAIRDRAGFTQFLAEADAIFGHLLAGRGDARHLLHTLKGNCAMFGVQSVAEACHRLEGQLEEGGDTPAAEALLAVRSTWESFRSRVASVSGGGASVIELDGYRYRALREATRLHAPYEQLDSMVAALSLEPAGLALGRAAEHARALAVRLGRPPPRVELDDGGLLLDPGVWREFWAAFVHIVRNAVDHGSREGGRTLRLSTTRHGDRVVVELADDGPGVDWERVAARALALGLPYATHADLREALFADGLSTLTQVTEVSGRGVGLGAFREVARALGGDVEVLAVAGEGTRIRVAVPGTLAVDARWAGDRRQAG